MKKCTKCNIEKTLDSFQIRNKKTKLRRNECKSCISDHHKKYYQKNKKRIILKTKKDYFDNWKQRQKTRNEWMKNNPEKVKKYYKKYKKKYNSLLKNKQKSRARDAVKVALKNKKIIKPSICEKCKKHNNRIEGHHYLGYGVKNKLKIMWLCPKCHRQEKNIC